MNDIETIFKEKSKNLRIDPSHQAWDRLEAKLGRKQNKHFQLKSWLVAASITALIVVGGGTLFLNKDEKPSWPYETISMDFSKLDYGDATSKINTLHQAYLRLQGK